MGKLLFDYILIKRSTSFDVAYYLASYPDVRKADIDPLWHFVKHGWREGKNPSEDFDTNFYLREYPDVREANINPLVHYLKFGTAEGRPSREAKKENQNPYSIWLQEFDTLSKKDYELIRRHLSVLSYHPKISIFMPVQNPESEFFTQGINSILAQLYPKWELFILTDRSSQQKVDLLLKEKHYQDSRITVLQAQTMATSSSGLSSTLENCSGDFFGIVGQSDILRAHALYMIVKVMNDNPHAEIVYSDNDWIDRTGRRTQPYFKPEWNPDLFCTHNYIKHFGIFRTKTARRVGGFREEFRGAEEWDLALRISEIISPADIYHVPFVLYHRRKYENTAQALLSTDISASIQSEAQALFTHFSRLNIEINITQDQNGCWHIQHSLPTPKPLVSIIIPTRNKARLLDNCLKSIFNKSNYTDFEIIIVNNQSDEESALTLLKSLQNNSKIKVLEYHHPFNYSAINNFAVEHADGEILVFLNNDIEVISPNWLDEMVSNAIRPEIGAVGAKLYYPDGSIQHAGLILNPNHIALHIYHKARAGVHGDNDRARMAQNLSAVTAACMAIEKRKFSQVKGFDQTKLRIAYNDVDLCLRLMRAGYRNLWTPYAELIHFESASRGYEDTPEKQARIQEEAEYMHQSWGGLLGNDPAYNPNLTTDLPDFSLSFPPRVKKPWNK